MPAESTPETTAAAGPAAPSTPAPSATPGTAPSPSPATPQKAPEPSVPASRLREETGRRVRAEAVAAQLQQDIAQVKAQIATMAAATPPEAKPGRRFPNSEYREMLFRQLGGDDQAYNAVTMMDEHADAVAQERGYVTPDQVQHMIQANLGLSEQKQQVLYGITGEVNKWITKGVVTTEQAQAIHGRVMDTVRQHPEILGQPHNIRYLLSEEFRTAVVDGDVRPYTAAPASPMQPSGRNGGPAIPADDFDRSRSPIKALRNLPPDAIRKARERSMRNHAAATGAPHGA